METLHVWLGRQYRHAATAMLASVSPCGIVKTRPGAGQTIRPVNGAIVASPVLGAYDPEPDYFFHWYRDSALVVDAMRVLQADRNCPPGLPDSFADFVSFSLALQTRDGRTIIDEPGRRNRMAPAFLQYLRPDDELASVQGDSVAAEARVNPDGTLDILRWARPQHDGPALRALAVLRWARVAKFDARTEADIDALALADLAYTLRHALEPCFDIWEEQSGLHYYTLSVSAAALETGAAWLGERADHAMAQACRARAQDIIARLDAYWVENEGYYRSGAASPDGGAAKALDIAVIMAAIHSGRIGKVHSVRDPRMQATLARLDALFDTEYAINRGRPVDRGPAMGRYSGDKYFSGGAYYFATLAAAEFCYRAGQIARGDAYLRTVQAYTPLNGDLSEQFDQNTGLPSSARQLAWSYAAFITCVAARRRRTPDRPA
jgi:glucoamylase